jgi:hypothetical protein
VSLPEKPKSSRQNTALRFSAPEMEKKKKMMMVFPVHRISLKHIYHTVNRREEP